MIEPYPVVLEGHGIRLEPLERDHVDALGKAAADGELWNLWYTGVPEPSETGHYVARALAGRADGHMLPWAVRELGSGEIVGTTRYHDIVAEVDRVEIGYTWYARRWQRTHVNTACKLAMFGHAFDTLACKVVGLRTDNFNLASRRAIASLGAKQDGIIRHHALRRDGSIRDTVMFSVLASEWPDLKKHLEFRLLRNMRGERA